MKTPVLTRTVLLGGACLLSAMWISSASFAEDAQPLPDDAVVDAVDNAVVDAVVETLPEADDEGEVTLAEPVSDLVDEEAVLVIDLDDEWIADALASGQQFEIGATDGSFVIGTTDMGANSDESSAHLTQEECLRMFPDRAELCATFE
jgi:hypothetical protein